MKLISKPTLKIFLVYVCITVIPLTSAFGEDSQDIKGVTNTFLIYMRHNDGSF